MDCPACAGYWLPFGRLCDACRQTCAWPDCGRRLPERDAPTAYPLLTLAQLEPTHVHPYAWIISADERRLCAECLRYRYRRSGRGMLCCPTCGSSSCDARFGGLLGLACTSACSECERLTAGRSDFTLIECTHRRRRVHAASVDPDSAAHAESFTLGHAAHAESFAPSHAVHAESFAPSHAVHAESFAPIYAAPMPVSDVPDRPFRWTPSRSKSITVSPSVQNVRYFMPSAGQ